jgi:hypothetical protein
VVKVPRRLSLQQEVFGDEGHRVLFAPASV